MLAWERQENESARAFEAFVLYRDMGAARSLAKVGQVLGKSTALMERWSVAQSWVDRVKALEARDEMLRREAIEEFQDAKAKDHARREAELREKALEAREMAMDKALKILQWPLSEQHVVREGEDGETQTLIFLPAKWSTPNAVTLFQMAVGDAPHEEDPDALYGETDFSDLTDEELSHYVELSDKLGVKRPER